MFTEIEKPDEYQEIKVLNETVNHLRTHWFDENAGIVAATLIEDKISISATSLYLPKENKWLHAEASALELFKKRFQRSPDPSSTITITLSPCVRESESRYSSPCSQLLLNSSVTKVIYGCLDNSQAESEDFYKQTGFDAKIISDKGLQRICRNLFMLFDELYKPGGEFSNLVKLPNPWPEIKRQIGFRPFFE